MWLCCVVFTLITGNASAAAVAVLTCTLLTLSLEFYVALDSGNYRERTGRLVVLFVCDKLLALCCGVLRLLLYLYRERK